MKSRTNKPKREKTTIGVSPDQHKRFKDLERKAGLQRSVLIDRLLDLALSDVAQLYSDKSIRAAI